MSRTKKIFISDIHMGDADSILQVGDNKPYGWLSQDRADLLANFLNDINSDTSVAEVIILGDLFDQWVCPIDCSPVPTDQSFLNQYQKIAAADQNKNAISALRTLATNNEIKLTYVPGNHDMLLTNDILTAIIPGINYLGDSNANSPYDDGYVKAEHGHKYCLFNAPDERDDNQHILPLGFYITRYVAKRQQESGKQTDQTQLVWDAIKNMKDLKSIAGSVFEAFTEQVQTDDKDDILMNGIDSFQGSVKRNDVEKTFQDLYSEWDNGIADFSLIAMLNEVETPLVNRLDLVAFLKYYASREVVIFGHTHQYLMVGGNPTPNSPLQEMTQCSSPELYNANLNFIYANSGAWEDHTSVCTFIETERVEWTHTVRVKQYTKDQKINLLDERYVDLTMKRIEEFIADAIKVVDDGLEAGLKEINGSFQWSDSIGVELGNILRNNYQLDVQGAANVLAKAKVVANKAAKALMVYYAGGEKGPIDEILKKAGYAEDEISKIIHLIPKPHIPPIPHIHIHHFPF